MRENDNMYKPLISVIVPIYKVEKFLKRCIDSILSQSYDNLEIILVDDGSPDSCGKICDEYSRKDKRIKVLHKENGGLSDARNKALDIYKGEYVTFIDSDDYVSKYYIENLYNALEQGNADLAMSWFENVFDGKPIKSTPSYKIENSLKVLNAEECLTRLLYQDGVETSAWGKLYPRKSFIKHRFPKGKLYEDIPVTSKIIAESTKIAVISNVDYYYYQRIDGIQNEKFRIQKMDGIIHMKELLLYIQDNFPNLEKAAICRYFSTICNIIFQINNDKFEEQKNFLWNEIVIYRKCVVSNHKGRRKARIAALISYLGYDKLKFVYKKTQWRG